MSDQPHQLTGLTKSVAPSKSQNSEETSAFSNTGNEVLTGFGPPVVPGEVGSLGPYRIVKELGKGGMGAVYAAIDTRLERRLALKVMLPQFATDWNAKARFLREARAAARIKHDNVVTVYEADERNGVPYIAMEFLEGYSLDEYHKKKGSPSIPQLIRIASETAAGLGAAHAIDLVHRDIKPGNLWLETPNGRVKVLDFGLAKSLDTEIEVTKSGAVVGTPAYMSPEQARGQKVDHRTDLFSLGVMLYRFCADRLPFEGPTTMAVLMALGTEEPRPVRELNPEVPQPLAALIHQLLAKKADDRPQTAAEVRNRLRAIARDMAVPQASLVQSTSSQPATAFAPHQVTESQQEANPFASIDRDDATERHSATSPATEANLTRKKPGGKIPWSYAGLAALVLCVVAGPIIIIKNKEGTETKIEVPEGTTVTVNDKKEKSAAQVGPASKKTVTATDPDRNAAEYAISIGGKVRVNNEDRDIKVVGELPKERFRLTELHLSNTKVNDTGFAHFKGCDHLLWLILMNTPVTDAGLEHLKDCKSLSYLLLSNSQVGDAGLARLKNCNTLKEVNLSFTKVSNAGLAYLKDCNNLTSLHLGGTQVSDAGLVHLKDRNNLNGLHLAGTRVGDEGLAYLKNCKNLRDLGLENTQVSDTGLAHLKNFNSLQYLHLDGTQVTDVGLAHLKDCKSLLRLHLSNTQIGDAGLSYFKDAKKLILLDVRKTKVTAKGLEDFYKAVPGCKIENDGDVIEPKK